MTKADDKVSVAPATIAFKTGEKTTVRCDLTFGLKSILKLIPVNVYSLELYLIRWLPVLRTEMKMLFTVLIPCG